MAPIDLQSRFPDLRPIAKAPSMRLINGCGTRVVGSRDRDPETQSFITTLCFCLLFIPIFAIRAYRVIPSPRGGWYFLGRVPLSTLARVWNILFGLAVITTGVTLGLTAYTSRPEYIARQRMAQAGTLADQGQLARAAAIYADFAAADGPHAPDARQNLKDLIDNRCARSADDQAAGVFTAAARLTMRGGFYTAAELVTRGLDIASGLSAENPRGALTLLDVLRPLAIDPRAVDQARLPLLEKWVAAEPANPDAAVALASLQVDNRQYDDARKLLLPFRERLGTGEGARVLGLVFLHDDKYEDAASLLQPYVKPRLERLHAAEKAADDTIQKLWDHEIQLLRDDKGPPDLYRRLDSAPEDQQGAIVRQYVGDRLKDNPRVAELQAAVESESRVVPVVLELGIGMLQHAQSLADPVQRKTGLETAQELFLSIKSSAGESDEYRLFLGQVYYWLGKQADGRALFDEFLKSNNRSAKSLLQIASTLRDVGLDVETRALAEEAFTKAATAEERHAAAYVRSLVSKDVDDEIEWLRKSDTNEPMIKVNLATCLGRKAMREDREDEAAAQYRSALDVCATLPRNQNTLNQTCLVSEALYRATGDPKDMDRAVDAIQQALALSPSDPVLLFNAAVLVTNASIMDLIGQDLDLRTLRLAATMSTLEFLNHDDASRLALAKRLADHPGIVKSLAYLDKVMVISPKHVRGYAAALQIRSFLRDETALRAIAQRLQTVDLDTSDEFRETKEMLGGVNDARDIAALNTALKRYRTAAAALKTAPGGGGASLALALASQAGTLMQRDALDGSANPDEVVQLAADAYAAAPSSATRATLMTAYAFRVFKQLRQSTPEFDAFAKGYYRSVGHQHLLAFLVQQKDPLSGPILAHADFQRFLSLLREDKAAYPTSASGFVWAIFSVTDPTLAQKQIDNYRTQQRNVLDLSITALLAPASGTAALDSAWMALALGRTQEAKDVLSQLNAKGIPVPTIK